MLIVGLLVGGLILICLIAFAYAKFSQTKDEEVDQEQIKNGLRGANARKAQGRGRQKCCLTFVKAFIGSVIRVVIRVRKNRYRFFDLIL